jgi:hypothetical protein
MSMQLTFNPIILPPVPVAMQSIETFDTIPFWIPRNPEFASGLAIGPEEKR